MLTTSTPGLAAKPSAVKSLPEPQEWQAYHFYSDHWFLLVKMVLIKVTNAAFISAALGRHPAEGEIRALCEASERPALQRGSPLGTQFSCSSPQGTPQACRGDDHAPRVAEQGGRLPRATRGVSFCWFSLCRGLT